MSTTDTNIVEFGLSQIHMGLFTDNGTTVTMGTPMALNGAKNLSVEVDENENTFYADNRKYWTVYEDHGVSGELEVAKFTDAIKKEFFGYLETAQGGLAMISGATKPKVYLAFEFKGDAQKRRGILYNVSLGSISRAYSTTEENTEPTTEKCSFTSTGDVHTSIVLEVLSEGASGYATLFTNPAAPAFPTPGVNVGGDDDD